LLARFLFNDFVGLLSAFLVAVSPWHVVYSRVGFGILQLTFFFSLGLYLFLRGLKGDGRLMVLGGFCFGLTFFSYYLAHVFAPLFLFGIHYLVYNEVKSSGKERLYYLLLFILILFLLLSLTTPYLGKISLLLVDNIPNAVSNFSELLYSVFLLKGNWSWPPYSGVFGVVYPVCIPLLVLGLVLLVWNRNFQSTLILYWLFLAFFLNAFISSASTGSLRRVFTCAGPVFEIVVAYAVYRILVFYSASRKVFWLLFGLFSIGLLLGIYPFLVHYFVYQPVSIEAEKVFMVPVKDLFNYTESVKDRYDKIIITDRFVVLEDYVFFYTKTRLNDSTYVLGNVSSYPPGNRTLFVVRDYELANVTPKKIFYYSNGEVAYKVVE